MIKQFIFFLGLLLFGLTNLSAQKTEIYNPPDADYRLAIELFNKEQYGAAQRLFVNTIDAINDKHSELRINATYYAAICAVELFHPDAEKHLVSFIQMYPTHPKQGTASLQMGHLQYRKRKYEQAIEWYSKVDLFDLNHSDKEEFYFKKGYSHFMLDETDKAKQYFFEVKSPLSLYFAPAQYYYAHISYTEKNYETALLSFQKITDNRNFGPIVPYYITHIYFLQKKYDEVLDYAPDLLEESSTRRTAEIARIIGESYFQKKDYKEATEYLQRYHRESRSGLSRTDHYQLGFAYYNTQEYEKAISSFERVTGEEDSLAQNAYFHLADSYLQTNQKRFARNAFVSAFQMDFYPKIKQQSLFNYAQLSYELSFSPYNEAILAFQKYIEDYPESENINKAQEYIINLYLTTRNYKNALTSIEELGITTPRLREAYQRIAYYRGIELFNNGDFTSAIEHFSKSMQYPQQAKLVAGCIFWSAEAEYRLEHYDKAIELHREFLTTPGAFDLDVFHMAHYTIGYARFKQKDYENAVISYRQFVRAESDKPRLVSDAYLRIADSYFMLKNYDNAINFYQRAIKTRLIDTDYAMYQKALVEGVKGDFSSKIESLKKLLNEYPNTSYTDDALFELGNTYMITDNSSQALYFYNQLMVQHPNSGHVKNAKLQSGLIYYNDNRDNDALEVLKSVVSKYPGTKEASEALAVMKNIYVHMDRVDEYFAYAEQIPFADVTRSQQDTLTYVAAEQRYMQGDCTNAVKSFANYIDQFPDGIFSTNARFYKAECDYRMNEFQVALRGYEYVLSKPKSQFSENAALRASSIQFRLNNYEAALNHFITLEAVSEQRSNILQAKIGQMRCYYRLSRFEQAVDAAKRVVEDERTSRNILQEAHLISGRSYLSKQESENASASFKKAEQLGDNEMAAEAKYYIALIEFQKGDYEKSEDLIFNYINEIAAYDYWLAKMFILLADNYLQTDNVFQAKQTLQSIIENYDGEELNSLAREKLRYIEIKEEQERLELKQDTLEVEF